MDSMNDNRIHGNRIQIQLLASCSFHCITNGLIDLSFIKFIVEDEIIFLFRRQNSFIYLKNENLLRSKFFNQNIVHIDIQFEHHAYAFEYFFTIKQKSFSNIFLHC